MLAAFRKGVVGGVKVHVDRLQVTWGMAVVSVLRAADPQISAVSSRVCCFGSPSAPTFLFLFL